MDHDQRFKILIQHFFADFLWLFFRPWAERMDCTAVEWLDKEVFHDPPEGSRRILDLVAKLPTRQGVSLQAGDVEHWLALVHIEIESPDKAAPNRPRMFRSYVNLRAKYALPVLPIGLYLKVGLDGIGIDTYEEHFWELRAVHFQYLYVGLPALDALEYLHGDNWLGVALSALMKIPRDRAAWLGAEALRRITEAPLDDQRRFLLGECVQAYLPLDAAQQGEFERLVAGEPYKGVKAMNVTWFEKGEKIGVEKGEKIGVEKGKKIGAEEGRRDLLREQIEDRFGPLPAPILERLEKIPASELSRLGKTVLRAESLRDLGLDT
jgi:hypothetical protein